VVKGWSVSSHTPSSSVKRSPIWSCIGRTRRVVGDGGSGFFSGCCLAIRHLLQDVVPVILEPVGHDGVLGVVCSPIGTRHRWGYPATAGRAGPMGEMSRDAE